MALTIITWQFTVNSPKPVAGLWSIDISYILFAISSIHQWGLCTLFRGSLCKRPSARSFWRKYRWPALYLRTPRQSHSSMVCAHAWLYRRPHMCLGLQGTELWMDMRLRWAICVVPGAVRLRFKLKPCLCRSTFQNGRKQKPIPSAHTTVTLFCDEEARRRRRWRRECSISLVQSWLASLAVKMNS